MSSPEHAQFYDFLGPQGADMLRLDSVSSGSLPAYINGLVASQEAEEKLMRFLDVSAKLLEPYYGDGNFVNNGMPTYSSFLRGCSLAVRLARLGLPNLELSKLAQINFDEVRIKDSPTAEMTQTNYKNFVVFMAQQGYDAAQAFHALLEEWIDDICPQKTYQDDAKLGFGYGYELILEFFDRRDVGELKSQVELLNEGYEPDWDTALQELL